MTPTRSGSVKFFKLLGITVFIHWSWFIIAVYDLQDKTGRYTSMQWKVWEYLVLFGLVTIHEFGHALACRSVGGKADTIVLWPLGGVAYVDPPQRPGATLWSIAAGPLVNVLFFPIFSLIYLWARNTGLVETEPNAYAFISAVWYINTALLVFNMMPIYPLDGGQILRSVLWFMLGKARSLFVATIIGMGGVVLLILVAFAKQSIWIGIMSAFILMNCWSGLKYARVLSKIAALPKHPEFACPSCHTSPPAAPVWVCRPCGVAFDTFVTNATCPKCAQTFATARCVECGESAPIAQWAVHRPSSEVVSGTSGT
ncbi:MAG: M50 family metallopeptidase [Limisphaerales bacterium]